MGRQRDVTERDVTERTERTEQVCARCGRRMPAGAGPDRRWCSERCRRQKLTELDRRIETELRARLGRLASGATLCPSEVARAVDGTDSEGWRELMEPTRQAGRRLVAAGLAEITQRGHVVDPSTARGPIRIRRAR